MTLKSIIPTILILALAVRLVLIPTGLRQAASRGIGYYDEYGGIAKNIVEGKGFSYNWYGELRPTSIHSPLYPFLLAGVFSLFGTGKGAVLATIMLNIILSMILLLAVFRISLRLFGRLTGLVSLVIIAFYPGQIYYSVSGLPTIFYTVMLLLVIVTSWRLKKDLTIANAFLWGLAIGFCALSYSFVMALAPLLAVWIIACSGGARFGKAVWVVSIAAITVLIVITPWTIRNYRVHQRWIPIRDQSGTNLWWGNGPRATGGVNELRANSEGTFSREITDSLRAITNEVDGDRYLKKMAVDYMKNNPGRTARLWIHKIWIFWWFDSGPVSTGAGIDRFLPVLKVLKGLLLILSIGGFFLLLRGRPDLAFLGLIVCTVMTLVFMVFFSGRIRYFTPLEPILLISAGYFLTAVFSRLDAVSSLAEKI